MVVVPLLFPMETPYLEGCFQILSNFLIDGLLGRVLNYFDKQPFCFIYMKCLILYILQTCKCLSINYVSINKIFML